MYILYINIVVPARPRNMRRTPIQRNRAAQHAVIVKVRAALNNFDANDRRRGDVQTAPGTVRCRWHYTLIHIMSLYDLNHYFYIQIIMFCIYIYIFNTYTYIILYIYMFLLVA